jgi:type IV pilus assembly protein PilE
MRYATGFTLIELMIAVVVVAILSAIALPSYTSYVQRGKITEATSSLSELRLRAEKYFADNRTYQNAGATDVGFNEAITGARYFTYDCGAATATTFTCTATGVGDMVPFSYTINESNVRGSDFTDLAGWTDCATRWVIRKGDAC